jgi:DNA-binding IclR family transcriptional regulator
MLRNERKRAVLDFLASKTRPATVREIAWGVRLPYPTRGLYPLLAGYLHWGLVRRWRGPDGRYHFKLADRGRVRLAWLRRRSQL